MIRFLAPLLLLAGPALADAHADLDLAATGDAAAGEKAFRQCQSCHNVVDPEGEVLAGRANMRTGPNLYGVAGRVYGALEDYSYSSLMEAAGETGARYDEANFAAYVMDPTKHLQEVSGENGRGKMSYKVRKEEDAIDLYAFLAQYGTEEMEAAE
ncbi:cytochrome c family protein [Jannaschia sp. W003]|uniref:c-type cytochrome n=1 Tax=Jannaschia sp. W003 TaxID=2867012 RepID=UPI0021A5BCB6|nr:cytochrome C [Jannaschia sp. W003]UWQ21973.1 cytochrome C [Jannaschia sp. W003]